MAQIEEKRPLYKSFSEFASTFHEWQRVSAQVLLLVFASVALSAHGQVTANWTGNGHDSLWTDADNWDTHAVPGANGANDTVVINLQGSNFVLLNTNLTIGIISLGGGQGTNILDVAGGSIQCSQAISIAANGILEIQSNLTVNGGNFQNSGTVMLPPNLGAQLLALNCSFTNYGTFDAETNSQLSISNAFDGQPQVFLDGTLFTGPGTVTLAPTMGGFFSCSGTITVNGTLELQLALIRGENPSTWTGTGLLLWQNSEIDSFTFATNFHAAVSGFESSFPLGYCTNRGTIYLNNAALEPTFLFGSDGGFYNYGTIQAVGDCGFQAGSTPLPVGSMQNSGTIIIPPGLGSNSLTFNCNFTNYGTIAVESDSELSVSNGPYGSQTYVDGTIFDGSGTLDFADSQPQPITCSGTMTVNGTVELQEATINGLSTWTGPGLFVWQGGEFNNVTFAPGFQVEISGANQKIILGSCINQGTISWLGGGPLEISSFLNSELVNDGALQIEGDCAFDFSFAPFGPGNVQNSGSIIVPAGLGTQTLLLNCNFTNYGTIDVETNSILDMSMPNTTAFESGTVFAGVGTIQLDSDYPGMSFNGTMTVDGTIVWNEAFQTGNAIWTGPGLLQFIYGGMISVTFAPGFNVEFPTAAGLDMFGGNCTNEGTMRVLDAISLSAPYGGQFYNSGLLQIETNCELSFVSAGISSSNGIFQNTGTIRIPPGRGELSLNIGGAFTNYGVIDVETNSTLDLDNDLGSTIIDFESGTVFAGPGTVNLTPTESFNSDGTITVDGTVIFSGSQNGSVIWTGPGLLQFLGGEMDNVTFGPGLTTEMFGDGPWAFVGTCTNQGTIRILGSGGFDVINFFGPVGPFYNSGVFQIESNFEDLAANGGFENTGIVRVPPNLGVIPLPIECPFTNYGVIEVETNSELVISNISSSGSQTYLGGTTFDGSGTVSFMKNGNGGIACWGSMTDNCALNLQSDMSGASTWSGSGRFDWLGGAISNITFAQGFHAQISGPTAKFLTGACTNQGTVCWFGGSQLNDSMTSGQFGNSGTLQITTGGVWNNIPINNTGTFRQLAGTFSVPSFTNMGAVQAVSGLLNVASNFFSGTNSSYQITVDGTTPGTGFHQLNAQNLTLNGSLQVVLTNGFSPAIGNSFAVMTGSRSGSFFSSTLPSPQNNLMWHVQYLPMLVALEVAQRGALTDMGFVNGAFQFSFNDFASGSYDIQASSNLIDWTTIETNYPFSGSVTVTDTNSAEFPHRFYRARIFP